MSEKKYAAIAAFLVERIQQSEVEQKYNFDLKAQSFKVQIPNDTLMLTVSESLVEDFEIPRIIEFLEILRIPSLLIQRSHEIIFVGTEGVQYLSRR